VAAHERLSVAIRAAIFPASPSSMLSEPPTASCEVFENALFAICLQNQARSHAAQERYRRGSRVGKSEKTDVLIPKYASLPVRSLPRGLDAPKTRWRGHH
jgi:hypothetical protein